MIPRKYLPVDKMRQRICESSPELRSLAAKLEQAYINKERAAQIAERNLARQQGEIERRNDQEQMMEERIYLEDFEKKELQDSQIMKLRYQQQLDMQMQDRQRQRERLFQQFLEDKKMIDEAVSKIQMENEEAVIGKLSLKMATKQQVIEFMEAQKVWREREERRIQEENAKIAEFIAYKELRDKENHAMMIERRKLKNENVLKLAMDIRRDEDEKKERDNMLLELYEGRKREEDSYREKIEMENEIRKRINLREANILAAQYRRDREEKEKQQDEEYRQKMLDKFAEDDRLEQMNEQRRRMRREEHRRAVQKLLDEKKMEREKIKAREIEMFKEQQKEEDDKRKIIEQERLRLLKENVEKLIGYIPKGVLSQDDVDTLGDQVKSVYYQRPAKDPLEELEKMYL